MSQRSHTLLERANAYTLLRDLQNTLRLQKKELDLTKSPDTALAIQRTQHEIEKLKKDFIYRVYDDSIRENCSVPEGQTDGNGPDEGPNQD